VTLKIVYCDHCKDISIKSRLEKETCTTCGRAARLVPYSRPWQYYAGSAILIATAALLILLPIPDLAVRLAILGVAVVFALLFSSWSITAMRTRVLRSVAREESEAREVKS
jgi:uncharacterized paraquat-inducible protein A